MSETISPNVLQGNDTLRQFQLTTQSISDKSSSEYGLAISKYIFSTVASGLGGYFYTRNQRFIKNRNYANGKIDIQAMFQDRFRFDGKPNYIALNWNALQIVNRIVSGLVGRWMQRNEKIEVTAIDTLSVKEKDAAYAQADFILNNRAKLQALQQESGMQIIPQGEEIPADQEELLLWQPQIKRLPEEILYETGCNDILGSNGWFDVLKEKMLHDAAEVLLVGTYVWMDDAGVIHVEWLKPENIVYSYSQFSDFRDTSWRGYMPSRKISELRRMYGKEFNPNNPNALTEQELWSIAQKCKNFQYWSNITWNDVWINSSLRPYDEWNIRTIEFELKTVDSESYTITKSKTSGSTYVESGMPKTKGGKLREKPLDNQEVIADTNWNIYRGVYLPDMSRLLQWGLKKNMIRPQDPKEIGNAEFSYSFVMPQNYDLRNIAVPEKIEAAVDGMILALLKMQQVIARMRPTGAAINEDAIQNIEYGLGDGNKDIDYKKLYDQTGDIYYRGKDAEGNPIPIPIVELQNTGFVGQMEGLIKDYGFHYQILKDELGEDPNLITQAVQPRVTGENVQASQQQSEFATDYIYNAYAECMKMTARKVSCLLKDSVTFGSDAYRKYTGDNDENLAQRQFATDIKFLPTDYELQKFEAIMNQAIQANGDLVLFVNPFQLMQIAKQDYKMAWAFFNRGQKKMLLHQQQVAQQNQQATFQAQLQSGVAAEQERRKTVQEEIKTKSITELLVSKENQKQALINGFMGALQKGVAIPAEWKGVETELIQNVAIPLFKENVETITDMVNTAIAADDQDDQQQQQNQQVPQSQPMPPQAAGVAA